VDANMLVLCRDDADFQAFNVGSGRSTCVLDYAQIVREKVSRCVDIRIPGEYRRGDNRHSVSSIERLRALGWCPKHDLSTVLDDFVDWVERSGGIPEELTDAYSDMKQSGVVLSSVQ
jgi:dTDP-L-rhamnose 4-epimerase